MAVRAQKCYAQICAESHFLSGCCVRLVRGAHCKPCRVRLYSRLLGEWQSTDMHVVICSTTRPVPAVFEGLTRVRPRTPRISAGIRSSPVVAWSRITSEKRRRRSDGCPTASMLAVLRCNRQAFMLSILQPVKRHWHLQGIQ